MVQPLGGGGGEGEGRAGGVNIVSHLVSKHCTNLTSKPHNSVNFHPIRFKLRIILSNKMNFPNLPVFKAELCFSKLVHIFWDIFWGTQYDNMEVI